MDSGIETARLKQARCGVSIGTTDGESQVIDQLTEQAVRHGYDGIDTPLLRQVPSHHISFAVARALGLRGGAITLPTACSAGNYAIGYAYDCIGLGDADAMPCGGADSVCRKTFAGFYRLGTIAPQVCQPFDKDRKGILTGEGAGLLLLESLDSALARGARIYAEVLGYGLTCDADHMVAPNRDSIVRCIRLAHHNAGVSAAQIQYICAHGTGTIANDITESGAIDEVFGAAKPPVSSINVDDRPHDGRRPQRSQHRLRGGRPGRIPSRRPSTMARQAPAARSIACPTIRAPPTCVWCRTTALPSAATTPSPCTRGTPMRSSA